MTKQRTHTIDADSIIGFDWWLNYLNEINFYNINELKELSLDYQPEMEDNLDLKLVMLVGIGKRSLLMGRITKAIDIFRKAEKIIKSNEDEIHTDIIAFFYYEYEMLFSCYNDLFNSKRCLKKMKQYAESSPMVALSGYKCALYKHDEKQFERLIAKVNRFKALKKYSSYVMGLYRIGVSYLNKKEFNKANEYYLLSQKMSVEIDLPFLSDQIHNAIGFLHISMDQYDKGIDYLLKHIENVESFYTRVLMTENMAYASYLKKDYLGDD